MSITNIQSPKNKIVLFLLATTFCICSCQKNESKIVYTKDNVQDFRISQETDASNLIQLENLSNATLKMNEEKALQTKNNRVINFSKVIGENQTKVLSELNELANSRLIVINNYIQNNTPVTEKLSEPEKTVTERDYFESVEKNIQKEVELLQNIVNHSKDSIVLDFAKIQIKELNRMLALTKEFNQKITTSITQN